MKGMASKLVTLSQRASVSMHVATAATNGRRAPSQSSRGVRLAVALGIVLMLISPVVFAQQDLAGSMNSASNTVAAGKKLVGEIAGFLAFLCIVAAGTKIRQRSNEGENSQVKTGAIVGLVVAAVVLGFGGALLYRAGASLGMQASSYGQLPGTN